MYFSKSRRRKRSLKVFNLIQYANSQQQQQPQQQQLFRSCLHLSRRNRCEVAGRRASLPTTLTRTRQEVLVQAQAQAADTLSATNIVDARWRHRDKAEGATQSTHSVIATQKLTARCSLLRTIEELWALCQRCITLCVRVRNARQWSSRRAQKNTTSYMSNTCVL